MKRLLCLFGHNRVLEISTIRHLVGANINIEFGTKGHCSRCGYEWNNVRPDDLENERTYYKSYYGRIDKGFQSGTKDEK